MTSKAENFIHIKFENPVARQCKRDMLATEIDLIRMNKRLRNYIDSRMEELEIKAALEKKLRSVKLDLGRLQNQMPGVKIPKLLKGSNKKAEEEFEEEMHEAEMKKADSVKIKKRPKVSEITKKKGPDTEDLDAQLQDIQNQLDALA